MNKDFLLSYYKFLWCLEHFSFHDALAQKVADKRKVVHKKYFDALASSDDVGGIINVPSIEGVSIEQFKKDYLYKNRPIILKGFAKDWEAVKVWSPNYFKNEFSDYQFETYSQHRNRGQVVQNYKMREYIESLENGGKDYFRFGTLIHEFPHLKKHFHLGELKPFNRFFDFWTAYILFMGPAGGSTFTHSAFINNYFVQIYGKKRWHIFHPRYSSVFRPTVDRAPFFRSSGDFDDLEKVESALPHMERYIADIDAGDVLFIPAFHWHYVENLSISIGASCRVWSAPSAIKASPLLSLLTLFATNPSAFKGLFDTLKALNFGNFYQNNVDELGFDSKER